MAMKKKLKSLLISLGFTALSACGGGGDNQPTTSDRGVIVASTVNAAPLGNAGADQNVLVGATVTVDGGASYDPNGDALTYKWSLSARPSTSSAVLTNQNSVRPIFSPDVAGIYVVTLVVNDGKIDGLPVTATITASEKQVNVNTAPLANAGANQIVPVGTTVMLNGGASSDANGDALHFKWTLVSKPAGSVTAFIPDSTVKPLLLLDVVGTYSVTLVVNDGKDSSLPSTVLITAVAPPSSTNIAPLANAGLDQTVTVGSTVNLDGSLSTDPNGDKLTYSWSLSAKPVGSSAQIMAPTAVRPQFIADATGIYEVSLSVSDGKISSAAPDTINIVAMSPDAIVIQDTGIYRCATLTKQLALVLYSQGHTYLDRDHDGRPCEANDIANEIAAPYVPPSNPSGGLCYVHGYYRKNGTYVKGYYRSCRS